MGKAFGVTGRRPKYFPWGYDESDPRCIRMKEDITTIIQCHINNGYDTFISGMALGSDMYFAESVLQLKNENPDIKLIAEIPFPSQSSKWLAESRDRYNHIRQQCDEWNVLSDSYDPKVFFMRNKEIVDKSDELLAIWDYLDEGGTAQTIEMANEKGIATIILDYRKYK